MSLENPGSPSGGAPLDSTYVIDPMYGRRFTAFYVGLAGLFVAASVPRLYRSIRFGGAWQALGLYEALGGYHSSPEKPPVENISKPVHPLRKGERVFRSHLFNKFLVSIPKSRVTLGEAFIILLYYGILLLCLLFHSDLRVNSNRGGFLALAQLPAVFIFGTKNNPLSLILGRGYEKLNVLHRWSGRGVWLMATIHGSLWINQYLRSGQSDYLKTSKPSLGMAAYGTLCMLVLLSLRPMREKFFQAFFVLHVVTFVTFFIIICYHTPYARPWIYPPIAFYAADLTLRLFRYRIKDALIESRDTQMTLIHVPEVSDGWVAGQHVLCRVFLESRFYESHALTILNAPRSISALPLAMDGEIGSGTSLGGLTLAAKVCGDWSKALNELAQSGENGSGKETVTVMLDGPYGGTTLDFGEYETVLLVSGGSGVTFALGILDDLVGRIIKLGRPRGERTERIQFVWYIRSYGAILWFASMLEQLGSVTENSSLDLSFKFYVTCLCDPEAIPPIPNSVVEVAKPSISALLIPLLSATKGGGVGMSASGPESLTRTAQNTVATLGPRLVGSAGGVNLHTELFAL